MTSKRVLSALIFLSSLLLSFGLFAFKDFFKDASHWGLLGIFVVNLISSASFFLSGPAFLTVIAGGSLYSPVIVALVSALGATIGDFVGYAFGYSGRNLAYNRLQKRLIFRALENFFRANAEWILFLIAFIPNPFFDLVGLLAGIFGYSIKRFFLIVAIARFFRYLLLAILGSGL